MSLVPQDWEQVELSKVAEVQTGIAKGAKTVSDPVELPYLRVANVQDGFLDLSEIKTITVERHQINRYSLRVGDVLLTEGGDFDKLGRGTVWNGQIDNCIHQNHVFVVRTNAEILLPHFFSALASSPYGKQYFLSCAKQTTNLASINSTQLKAFPVLLPPLPEQRKIAEILSTWDEAIELTEQLIAAKQRRKQALMQRLLTGQVRFPGFADEWKDVKLEDVAKTNPLKTANITDEMQVSFVGMADVSEEAKLINQTTKRYAEVKNGFTPFINDDILVAKITPCFENGKGALAQNLKNGLGFGSTEFHVIRANPEKANVHFLYYHTITHQFRERGKSTMTGSAGQKRVPAEFVTSFKIGLPSLSEQSKIVDVLVTCDDELTLHQQKLAALRHQKQGLMQQLLTGRVRVTG